MAGEATQLLIELGVPDAPDAEMDRLTSRVRDELLQLDVDTVERPPAGPAPAGTRAVELLAIGALLVTAQQGWQVISSVVDSLRAWAGRGQSRSVKVTVDGDTIELSSATSEEQDLLIKSWLARRAAGATHDG